MRAIIAAMQMSLDGFIEGPTGTADWVDSWEDHFDLMHRIDACILGAGVYPGYEQFWRGVLSDPGGVMPLTGRGPTYGELEYARFADRTPHFVLSSALTSLEWPVAHIIRCVDEIRSMKRQPGRDIYAVGGATLLCSLMNVGLVDELRLIVHPVVVGGGKALFEHLDRRQSLELVDGGRLASGRISLTYRARSRQVSRLASPAFTDHSQA